MCSGLLRYDPGAIRLARGVDLMLTVIAAAMLAEWLGQFETSVPAIPMAVLAGFAGAFAILFTPVSTRSQEAAGILRMGLIITCVYAIGALAGTLSGSSGPLVLEVLWIGAIAFGFALDGLGGFWQRAGRVIALSWLFVFIFNQPHSHGLWFPVMGAMGTAIAICIRIFLWRPSPERTYMRIEKAFRQAMAEQLERIILSGSVEASANGKSAAQLSSLRAELQLSADLIGQGAAFKRLPPESVVMLQLALEVVRDAASQLTTAGRTWLLHNSGFRETALRLRDDIAHEQKSVPAPLDEDWMQDVGMLSRDDQFQVVRIAQAFRRLSLLLSKYAAPAARSAGAPDEVAAGFWHRLSWRLALQAAVAASVGYGVAAFFDLNHAYWVTLTVIIVLNNSLGATIRKSVQRTLGTAGGVLIALAIDPLLSVYPDIMLTLAVLSIPAIILFFDRNYAIAAGFIGFMVVIGLQTVLHLPVIEFWARIYDTVIGAAVGLGVSWLLFPRRTGQSTHDLATAYLSSCAHFLTRRDGTEGEERAAYASLNETASTLVSTARSYRSEQAPWSCFLSSSNGLDVMVVVLADYIVLYREARTTVLAEAGEGPLDPAIVSPQTLSNVARMDKRVLAEFNAVLEGREKQTDPALAEAWMAAMPETATPGSRIMADWVAMLYYARKVVQCLDSLRQDGMWNKAVTLTGRPDAAA
ncbi:FUSC family protein [Roseibium marinum]|uniref:Fusaric acid resistance family protein n=1 Tax=Roseibium marinum TaxID=281252 RepID=A0A2S3UX58_9HYPH|nr:FUSC family protein [Roseibium marinum]POF32311.1 fusaric acid resistance family protein [Roseibium marinum]